MMHELGFQNNPELRGGMVRSVICDMALIWL
jgi:hypothetical protein